MVQPVGSTLVHISTYLEVVKTIEKTVGQMSIGNILHHPYAVYLQWTMCTIIAIFGYLWEASVVYIMVTIISIRFSKIFYPVSLEDTKKESL